MTSGSALSNASALWSLIAVLISIILRRRYPGGVLANDYEGPNSPLEMEKKDSASGGKYSAMVHPSPIVDMERPPPPYSVSDSDVECGGNMGGSGGNGGGYSDVPPPMEGIVGEFEFEMAPLSVLDSPAIGHVSIKPASSGEVNSTVAGTCELVEQEGNGDVVVAENGPAENEKKKEGEEKDGCCTMFWDECDGC